MFGCKFRRVGGREEGEGEEKKEEEEEEETRDNYNAARGGFQRAFLYARFPQADRQERQGAVCKFCNRARTDR